MPKESRFIDVEGSQKDRIEFHETFAKTQNQAKLFAKAFNERTRRLVKLKVRVPEVSFLDVSVYVFKPKTDNKEVGYLVEKRLQGKWHKWNNNAGYVLGQHDGQENELDEGEDQIDMSAPLEPIREEEGSSDEEDIPLDATKWCVVMHPARMMSCKPSRTSRIVRANER